MEFSIILLLLGIALLAKYQDGEISQLGGHLQAKEFPTYDKLEAKTHSVAERIG